MTTRREVGHIPVDAGLIVLLDPAYLPPDPSAAGDRVRETVFGGGGGAGPVALGERGFAEAVVVGVGDDGSYPVYVTYGEDGRPREIVVALDDDLP